MKKHNANNYATRSEIIKKFQNYGGAGWLDSNPQNPKGDKKYCILRSFKDFDIRLYLNCNDGEEEQIRMSVYSSGKQPKLDIDILRKVNIHPSTGAVFVNGAEKYRDKDEPNTYNLFHLVRHIKWSEMSQNDYVTLFADYCWLIAELHRIGAL